ncbi:uncharacterized protein [Fopius arisanus]|uniref:Uncharacterized protein n=1 Tax=Fopius arisanus TaxID=64838 RepID=A0A9R1UAQ3_9HYME|nr:PREDICTED: uncharacterized protein LOC105272928 [Fopius arisanus]
MIQTVNYVALSTVKKKSFVCWKIHLLRFAYQKKNFINLETLLCRNFGVISRGTSRVIIQLKVKTTTHFSTLKTMMRIKMSPSTQLIKLFLYLDEWHTLLLTN